MRKTAIGCLAFAACAAAHAADPATTDKEIQDLKDRISKLEQGHQTAQKSPLEFGKMRFFGYGEAHWNNPKTGTMQQRDPAEGDFHRLVLGWENEFDSWVRLATEVEFEHAGATIELEYAAMDFDASDHVTATVGALLMPVGMLNEYHEPTLFWSVERPYVEKSVIPTTWQELGFGVKTRWMEERLKYRAYVVQAVNGQLFTGADGIRGGRGKGGTQTKADDAAFVHRVEISPDLDLKDVQLDLGASHYFAPSAAQERRNAKNERQLQGAGLQIHEADARLRAWGFDLRGTAAWIDLSKGAELNRVLATNSASTIGSEIWGWYGELGYHLLPLLLEDPKQDLVAFVRQERYDTNHRVQGEGVKDLNRDVSIVTAGLAWFPVKSVALKVDFEHWQDRTYDEVDRINVGLAFTF